MAADIASSDTARRQIQDALLRYARGVDRLDAELISSAYYPDAEDYRGAAGPAFIGAKAGPTIVERLRASCDASFHSITNMLIEIDGDVAWSESYFQVWQSKALAVGTRRLHVCGRYVDRFEKRDGSWRIARRICMTDLMNETVTPDDVEFTHRVNGLRSRQDPSYSRI
jgi:hypothetical protein